MGSSIRIDWLRLVNQHNGNTIAYFVFEPACLAYQTILVFAQVDILFTLWAYQNFKEFRRYRHICPFFPLINEQTTNALIYAVRDSISTFTETLISERK